MTNQEKFISTFGLDAWQQMIAFKGIADQFIEYWTSPYKRANHGKMLVCPNCGLDVHSDFENCPRCGERMNNETDN